MTDNLLTEDIPEKFRGPDTGDVRMEALARSYRELEKKLSSAPSAPKTADDYCITCDHGMFEPNADVNARLHSLGMTQEQAQSVYDLAAEKMMPVIAAMSAEFQADREVEKLINHFGGAESWREISRQLLAFGRRNLPPDVLHNLSGSYEGVLALHRMMQSDEPGLRKGEGASSAMGEKELQSMMRGPRYWRDKDPSFVAQVTEGFQRMYKN
jgi:hypothetical protein